MTSKSLSWCQKLCHGVKKFVMILKSLSWHQKYVMTSKKFVMASEIRYDVKTFVMTSKSSSWRHEYVIMSKNTSCCQKVCYDVKKFVKNTWHQKYVMASKKFVMMSQIQHSNNYVKNMSNKATRSPEISRQQVQKLTPQFFIFFILDIDSHCPYLLLFF